MKAWATLLDDANAPFGFWYVGIYHTQEAAEAAKGQQHSKCRVVPIDWGDQQEPQQAEPVVWRYRYWHKMYEQWLEWHYAEQRPKPAEFHTQEAEPLYAAPPQPTGMVMDAGRSNEPVALNVKHPDCHKAADAFWSYWKANGDTHKHGYYESTWGAINAALKLVGTVPHNYAADPSTINVPREVLERSISRDPDVCYVAIKELRAMLKKEKS